MPASTPAARAIAKTRLHDLGGLAVLKATYPPPGRSKAYWPIPFRNMWATRRWLAAHPEFVS